MSYQVLARKWRPKTFEQMVGQEHVLRALVNALDNDRLHHAYLFTGTRGVGKTTIARILAKSLNCETGVSAKPCGECGTCREIDDGRFVDLIEVDAASRTKVEDTRELLENVQYAPTRGRYKVYLIDEVHMLSNHSFNALLKTLEEPPPHVKFLLATTDPQRLPVTILSRCLQFNLKRLPSELIVQHLSSILAEERVTAESPAIGVIARAADGSMRDALSLLDQAIAYGDGQLRECEVRSMLGTVELDHVRTLARALASGNPKAVLEGVHAVAEKAPDFDSVLAELLSLFHRVAVAQMLPGSGEGAGENEQLVTALANDLDVEDVQLFYQIGLIGRRDLPLAPDPRTGLEMVLLRMLAFRPAQLTRQSGDGETERSATIRAVTKPPQHHGMGVSGGATGMKDTEVARKPVPRDDQDRNAKPASPLSREWPEVVAAMNVDGLVRQLAANCAMKAQAEGSLQLVLAPSHASLHNKKLEDRLRKALEDYYGEPLRLEITLGSLSAETPALRMERNTQERVQAAQRAIEEDDNVRALKDTFNANVVPNSVRPVD